MWNGLVCARSYAVVGTIDTRGIKLVRLTCPWHATTPYKGPWSPGAPEWAKNPEVEKACEAIANGEVLSPTTRPASPDRSGMGIAEEDK